MRPLRLTMRGLRSYRGECTIEFQDRGLIAVVGDTGAGKSSILEAITYALYNATTWDQRAVGQLISDGAQSMSVELDFRAGPAVWSVHRATHRSSSRPSTHRLRCLSDPSAEEYDGEAAVSRQVERLLGMTYKAYLAAVVLPQGRFQTLLQETRARRTEILEGIFRLTDLRAVRAAARELGQRADVAVGQLAGRRAGLLPDPAGEVARLERELAGVERRERALDELRAEVERTQEAERAAAQRMAALREAAERIDRSGGAGAAELLANLVPRAAAIERERAEAAGREVEIAGREHEAAASAAEAARRGESLEDLAAAVQVLEDVWRALADLEAATGAARNEEAEIAAEAGALAGAEASLPELESAWQASRHAADEAKVALEGQRQLQRLVTEERRRAEALPALRAALEAPARDLQHAGRVHASARQALEEARRRDAAAHAAQGLTAGDPCPICGTTLGEGFEPPAAGALQPLERAVEEADAELARRRAAETTARARLDEAERRLAETVTEREAAEQAAQTAVRLLLLPVDERVEQLAAEAASADSAAQEAGGRWQGAQAEVKTGLGALEQRRARLRQSLDRVRSQRQDADRRLRRLPPALGLADAQVGRPGDLEPAIAEAHRRREAARHEREELERLRAAQRELASAIRGLERRLQDEVEAPRSRAMRSAAELLVRIDDGLGVLGRATAGAPPGEMTLEQEAGWAAALEQQAARLGRELTGGAEAVERSRAAAAAGLTRKLALAGLADAGDLGEQLRRVSQEVGLLAGRLQAARAQVVEAADLDRRIATGTEIRDSLSELQRLLQDGQFIGHVIERRQRQLLIVASQVLGSMTGNAYGFSPDFDIVDRRTNQPRPTRTLSGGETFLASLALALALVEIAARSGTQLDALFLDEGFGSLDASALDDALSALERQASDGRLVAVVSHVRAVAERIETVLEVTRSPAGSRADWRGPVEREQLLAEELETRLLA